jgi:ketosteroid isomerase-like protein
MKPVLVLQLLFVAVGSMFSQEMPDTARIRQNILAVMEEQVRGWNSGNIEAFMDGYARTDTLRFASGGTVTFGWKNMLERYKKSYPTRTAMGTLTFSGITIDLIAPDAAVAFGTWRLKRGKDEPWGLFTLLFKNINDEWRIVHDHTSSGN